MRYVSAIHLLQAVALTIPCVVCLPQIRPRPCPNQRRIGYVRTESTAPVAQEGFVRRPDLTQKRPDRRLARARSTFASRV